MSTLSGQITLRRSVLFEMVEDPNQTPQYVVGGTSSAISTNPGGQGKVDDTKLTGDFRSYGNGNTRLILGSGNTRTQTFAFRALSPAQVQVCRNLLGKTVCYRDTYGRRIIGAFIELQISDIMLSGKVADGSLLTDVGLVITSVTYDESV